jgi:hypothetical protein
MRPVNIRNRLCTQGSSASPVAAAASRRGSRAGLRSTRIAYRMTSAPIGSTKAIEE